MERATLNRAGPVLLMTLNRASVNVRAKDSPVAISECSPAEEAVPGSGADKYALDGRMRTVRLRQLPEEATKRFINHWKSKAQTGTC